MCYVVYIGTAVKLETTTFDPNNRTLHVCDIESERESSVKQHFNKPNVYYVGSDEGCGCGFSVYEDPDLVNEPDEIELMKAHRGNVSKFCELIERILAESKECEVFLCWDGDQAVSPEVMPTVNPDFFKNGDWVDDEPTLYKVQCSK